MQGSFHFRTFITFVFLSVKAIFPEYKIMGLSGGLDGGGGAIGC